MTSDAMVEEFDTFATWTADAVVELGPDHALPAACRGSGSPAALDWLATRMGLGPGHRLLDSGAGVGGPAEYLAREYGVLPVLVEPMEGACRAAVRLFARSVVVGDGAALPVARGCVDAAWSLGVLCTVQDKAAHLRELARVVGADGRIGLLVFIRTVAELPEHPDGNAFPDEAELAAALNAGGLAVLDRAVVSELPASPEDWEHAVARVDEVIERDHGNDHGYEVAQQQSALVGRLMSAGLLMGGLLICRAQPVRVRVAG